MREISFLFDEIMKWFRPSGLDSLVHFVTYKCNARCGHCFFLSEINKKGDLSKEEIFRVIKTVGKIKGLLISGGEPFLRDDLPEIIVEYVSKCGVKVASIPTNGFDTEKIIRAAREILEKCPDLNLTLALSLDGLYDLHDRQRGFPGGFSRTVETAREITVLRKIYPKLRFQIVTVITADNVDLLASIRDFTRNEIDPDYHWFELVRRTNSDDLSSRISRDKLKCFLKENISYYIKKNRGASKNIYSSRLLNKAIAAFSINNLEIAVDNFFDGKRWPVRCVAGRKISVIYPNGDVSVCELRSSAVNVKDFDYDLSKALKAAKMKKEIKDLAVEKCDCFHGCFIPPSVRYNPFYMGMLALRAVFQGRAMAL
ncbi:MAG: radical SAM protein [Candidatus Omnitrophota bacterium]